MRTKAVISLVMCIATAAWISTPIGPAQAHAERNATATNGLAGQPLTVRSTDFLTPTVGWAIMAGKPKSGWGYVFHTADGGKTWLRQLKFRDPGIYLNPQGPWMKFVDQQHGFLSALHQTSPSAIVKPILYRTVNGGHTWTHFALPPDAQNIAATSAGQSFDFANARDGWILAILNAATGDQEAVQVDRTTDGGAHWTAVARGDWGRGKSFGGLTASGSLSSIRFRPPRYGWLLGSTMTGKFYAYVTSSGGSTWRRGRIVAPQEQCAGHGQITNYEEVGNAAPIHRTWLLPVRVSFVCGSTESDSYYMYSTESGRSTWTDPVHLPAAALSQGTLPTVESIVGPNTWFFVSGDRLISTNDSGRSWRTYPLQLPHAAHPAALRIFASGRGYLLLSHTVVAANQKNVLPYLLERTTDGGRSWSRVRLPTGKTS